MSMTPELALYGNPPSDAHEPRKSDLLELFNGFRDQDAVSVKSFGAVGDGATDDTAAIREALATGNRVFFPKGDYLITGELEITHAGQIVEFETTGGHAYGENIGANWVAGTRLITGGAFARRIRTRRRFRGSSSDPQDAPLSCMINIQAEGVVLLNVCCWLTCDYSDNSPSNLGDDVDIGIFIGTRVAVQLHNVYVIGYFRRAGVYLDVTNGTDMPRFPSLEGTLYPPGSVRNGSDGFHMWNPYIRGPRQGLAVLGALPANTADTTYGGDYYDQALGTTVQDRRGSFGASDLCVYGGKIYGPDHHSNRRLYDPPGAGTALTQDASYPDNAPAIVKIDGLAGNASGNLWGIRFFGTRFATFEARRIWLERASRVAFYGCHIEGRNGGRFDTQGNAINTNDYTLYSYGDISNILGHSDRISLFGSNRQSYSDGTAPGWFTDGDGNVGPTLFTDSGRYFVGDYIQGQDLRFPTGGDLRIREGDNSKLAMNGERALLYLDYLSSVERSLDLRCDAAHDIKFRHGNATQAFVDADGFSFQSGAIRIGSAQVIYSTVTPENAVAAPPGSLCLYRDGDTTGRLYIKTTGIGNTGWQQVTSS